MICRSCGAEIADKAIVCYRCGTPTDMPAPRTPSASASAGFNWTLAVLIVVIAAAGAWLIPMTPRGSLSRIGAWAVLWIALLAVVAWGRRRR